MGSLIRGALGDCFQFTIGLNSGNCGVSGTVLSYMRVVISLRWYSEIDLISIVGLNHVESLLVN